MHGYILIHHIQLLFICIFAWSALDDGKPNASSSVTQLYQNLKLLESQLKGLQSTHDNKLIAVESTIDQLHQRVHEVNTDFRSIKEQIKTMEANIDTVTQNISQVQTSNEELRESNAHMQTQVSMHCPTTIVGHAYNQ